MSVETLQSTVLAEGFTYGEGPRWRDGRLWFTDKHADAVQTVAPDGTVVVGASIRQPSGIGWTPEGDLLATSLEHAQLHRITADGPQVHCDLSGFGQALNDMVALPDGRVYVDVYTSMGGGPPPGDIVLVAPDGTPTVVATGLSTPNGLAVSSDGSTLVASETFGSRLHAWSIQGDGSLADHRVFAELPDRHPDGLCMDAEGAVWVGCFLTCEFLRVRDGGEITHRVPTGEHWAVAPALGGADMRTLHLVIDDTDFMGIVSGDSRCRIETVEVEVPGVGSP